MMNVKLANFWDDNGWFTRSARATTLFSNSDFTQILLNFAKSLMKKIAFAALLCVLPASTLPVYAQGASAPDAKMRTQTAGDDYELQKAKARAPRFDSEAELRDQSKIYVGRIVELRGTVKGTFSRAAGFSLMLQQPDGTLLVEASDAMRGNPLLKAGTFVRALCRVENIDDGEPTLSLANLTDRAEPLALLKKDDDEGVAIAPPSVSAPAPDAILLGQEMELPLAPGLNSAGDALPTPLIQATAKLAPSSANPYFGFTEQHRANYKAFIRRDNPKLSDALAYEIAGAILNAARTHNLDPRFLCAVVQVESDFDPSCLSSSGAMGLGQLMPFNLKPLGVKNAWDPTDNLLGSAKLLRQNLNTYAQQKDGTLLAVAAYHAGVGAVNRAGMKVPKATTQRYVWKVYYAYRALAPELFR